MIVKPNCVVVAAVLTALATTGITVPARAQAKATVSWDTCHSLAVERGSGPTHEYSWHSAFMDQCLAGKVPLTAEGSPPTTRSLAGAFASASVPNHTSRRRAATTSRTELGTHHQ